MPGNTLDAAQLYTEVCKNIKETDDISFKLIGLIPLLSGASILTFAVGNGVNPSLCPAITLLALFAGAITLALYRWELRNIQTCNWQRERAKLLERSVFEVMGRRKRPKSPPLLRGRKFGKTEATKCVYSITAIAWLLFPAVTCKFLPDKSDLPALLLPIWEYAYIVVALVILFLTARSATADCEVDLPDDVKP